MASSELSRAIKSYIVADQKLSTLRVSTKEVRGQINVLSDEIASGMLAADLNIVRVPTANCEIELKPKETKKKESAAVKRVRETLETLRGKVISPDIETKILEATAPPSKDDDEEENDDEKKPQYLIKKRKIRKGKNEDADAK